jgi:FAD/FMN-containing dehydrogenase
VLVQLGDSGSDADLHARLEQALQGAVQDAVVAKNESEAKALWAIRETIPEAQFSNVKHDISVAVSKVPELIERADAAIGKAFPGVPIFCFGHVGDGNLHYNIGPETLLAQREAVSRVVYEIVGALGGSISAEHGLGQLKREAIRAHKQPPELELMRALKRTLDPAGLMNPGKAVPTLARCAEIGGMHVHKGKIAFPEIERF